jgi:glycosyltransferase involved in cell wall biosynthesis
MPRNDEALVVDEGTAAAEGKALCQLYPVDLLFGKTTFGASVAHLQLLQALARHGKSERELRLIMETPYLPGPPPLPPIAASEITNLRRQGMRATVHDVLELPSMLTNGTTVMISSGQESVRVLTAREICADTRSPVCTLCHSMIWPDFISSYSTAARLSRPFDCVVVPSHAGKEALYACHEILRNSHPKLWDHSPEPQIECIPYGIFPEEFGVFDQQQCRKLLGIPQDNIVLGCVGRITERLKADLDPLLMTTWRLTKQGLNPYLIVAGAAAQAGYQAELEAKASTLGISSQVSCRPDFDQSLKPLIYTASDICVFPVDNLQETFGLAVLEAMASSRPVVATNWSGYRDLVVPGETGFLVGASIDCQYTCDLAFLLAISRTITAEAYTAKHTLVDVDKLHKAILCLIENPDLRRRFGEAGRRRVIERFSWQAAVQRFEELWMKQRDTSLRTAMAVASQRPRQADRLLAAYAGKNRKPIALLCDPSTTSLISQYGVIVLGMLPAYIRVKARQCLELLARQSRLNIEDLEPELRLAALLLAKKGIVGCEYEEESGSINSQSPE